MIIDGPLWMWKWAVEPHGYRFGTRRPHFTEGQAKPWEMEKTWQLHFITPVPPASGSRTRREGSPWAVARAECWLELLLNELCQCAGTVELTCAPEALGRDGEGSGQLCH